MTPGARTRGPYPGRVRGKERTADDEATPLLPRKARGILLGVIGLMLAVSFFLPNVAILSRPPSYRWLPGTAVSFLEVTSRSVPTADPDTVGLGFTVTFLGLGVWQLGLLMVVLSAWILASAEVNRWLWVFLLIGSIFLTFGISTTVLGKVALDAARAPTTIGIAFWVAFPAALALLIWTLHARSMVDRTIYGVRPDLIT